MKIVFSRWNKTAELPTMTLQPVPLSNTIGCLKKLGNGTSFGTDEIDSMSVKVAAESLVTPINFLTNLSITKGKFCSKWKIARVIPLHKGGGEK